MAEQDRILGYFLDEAQEHLRVIEEGLVEPSLLSQPAQIKEIFRAAHSLKGGAAMLDLETIQQISHHFEQAFQLIKNQSLAVDQTLQTLLVEGFQVLRLSIQLLRLQQTPPASMAQEQVFEKIRAYISSHGQTVTSSASASGFIPDPAVEQVFGNYVNQKLLQFSEQCQRPQAAGATKKALAELCQKIGSLGESFEFLAWTNLLISCRLAVDSPLSTIEQLSQTIPTAIKQAQVLVMAGRHHAITPTPELEKLITPSVASSHQSATAFASDFSPKVSQMGSDTKNVATALPRMSSPLLAVDAPHSLGDFMFDSQPNRFDNQADISDMDDINEFMQLFDEELPVDGTWVQDEDILLAEDSIVLDGRHLPFTEESAALWEEDIFERPVPIFGMNEPTVQDKGANLLAVNASPPSFNFEQPGDSDMFMEDDADTAHAFHSPQSPEIDWSDLLADIPDEVVVDYQEPAILPGSDLKLSPSDSAENLNDLLNNPFALIEVEEVDAIEDPFANLNIDLAPKHVAPKSDILNLNSDVATIFNSGSPPSERPPDRPPDLPSLDELLAQSHKPEPTKKNLSYLDADDLRELSSFDNLLADTKTTDVNQSDIDKIIHNGNLESELELEDLEDFLQASVSPNQIDAPDNFLTEAKKTLNNQFDLEKLTSLTKNPMETGDIAIEDTLLSGALDFMEIDMNLDELNLDELSLSIDGIELPDLEFAEQIADLERDLLESSVPIALGESLDSGASLSELDSFSSLDELDSLLEFHGDLPVLEDFADLDTLLESNTSVMPVNVQQDDDEFDQIEKMLQRTDGQKSERVAANISPARAKKQRTYEQTMRVSVKSLNNLNNLAGELVVNRNTLEQDQNRMRQFVDKLLLEVQKLNEVGKSMQDLYERSLLESSLLANRQQHHAKPTPTQDYDGEGTMVEIEYDPLEMDRFTPIHLLSQQMIELTVRIRESTSDIEFVVDNSTEVTRSLRQINSQLQEDLNKSRMLPLAQTADRLQRGVRDNGLKYGKQVELHVEGRDTMIDKVILENLTDPLNHMVNNAIAHGIESPLDRIAAGKPEVGVITIRATHQGTQTIISISDDGAGIDIEKVKAKAIEKGIITPAAAVTMTKAEFYELLFLPSFSTKDQADELAGRGVGMDVVLTSLQEIRGTITTESKLGEGTTFTIRLPLALSIAKALMAVNKDAGIAFPMDGIEDSQDIKPEAVIVDATGQKFFQWRNQKMPFRPLSDLLSFNRPMRRISYYNHLEEEEEVVSIVVLRSGGKLIAVEVDRVVGEQEIVIKPLQGPAPKPVGIAGATVLGDGRIIPIADVMELIDLANGVISKQNSGLWSLNQVVEELPAQREPMVLVVDDSITVRQLLSLTFTRAGYRVEQARDGQEAWDKLRAGLPCDIIFCDIEMPRMDGLELLAKVQQDEALSKVPMAMLTSRGSDRHRQIASSLGASGYFIKPYLEDALLEAVKRMIKGEVLAII